MKFTACLSIATLATLSLGAFLFAQATDIKEIMAKANKAGGLFPQIQKGLKAPAPNWANLKNDSDELIVSSGDLINHDISKQIEN